MVAARVVANSQVQAFGILLPDKLGMCDKTPKRLVSNSANSNELRYEAKFCEYHHAPLWVSSETQTKYEPSAWNRKIT